MLLPMMHAKYREGNTAGVLCTFPLTPLSDRKFDCVIQSRDCAQGFLGQFSRRRGRGEGGKRNLQNTPLKNDCRLVPFLCDISLV